MNIDKDKLLKTGIYIFAALAIVSILLWGITGKNSAYTSVLRLYFVLFVLIGIIFYFARYFQKNIQAPVTRSLQVIEKLPLETGVSIYRIKAGANQLLIGVGNKQITLLEINNKNKESISFAQLLEQEMTDTFDDED
ncbi:MAG: flagellar biosynthetic protein FliO [Candidatus Margulisiibacteriota bacterium]